MDEQESEEELNVVCKEPLEQLIISRNGEERSR